MTVTSELDLSTVNMEPESEKHLAQRSLASKFKRSYSAWATVKDFSMPD